MPFGCVTKMPLGLNLIFLTIFYFESSNGCEPDEDCFPEFRFAHCLTNNSNYRGPTLFEEQHSSMATCHEMCQKEPDCDHAAYLPQFLNSCIGRNNKTQTNSGISLNTYIIPKVCVPGCSMDGVDFPFNDLDYPIQNVANHLECQKYCQEAPDCVGSTWIRPWNWFGSNQCFMKTSMLLKDLTHQLGAVFMPKYCLQDHRLHQDVFLFQNSRYKFISRASTYNDAMEICKTFDGALVSLETKEEYFFIRSAVFQLAVFNSSTFSGNYWIGLTRNMSQWIWASGLPDDEADFDVWCLSVFSIEGENSILNAEDSCVIPKIGSDRVENLICEFQGCLEQDLPLDPHSKQEIDRQNSGAR
ncbi:uncharacterized protein LOC131878398 isoform X2 [Tigriopus californicus]|nr:uncharacterized protein LOC131878398 isoform X2 [Tigriopus californicus]